MLIEGFKVKTREDIVVFCKAMVAGMQHGKANLVRFLMACEAHPEIWNPEGAQHFKDFDEFIGFRNLGISPEKYRRVVSAVDLMGVDVLNSVGVDGALQLLRVSREQLPQARAAMEQSKISNGYPIQSRYARQIAERFGARIASPDGWKKDLRKENENLRRENARLCAENLRLSNELAELRQVRSRSNRNEL